jgi:hypothetical protein
MDVKLENIILSFFRLQLTVKMVHWTTKNYNIHKITDTLHADLQAIVDRFVETYQGKYGRLPNDEKEVLLKFDLVKDTDLKNHLHDTQRNVINNIYSTLDREMTAILDDMLELLETNEYLLSLH